MERLLIILAVLVCVVAGIAVVAMSVRGRRPPLRMDGDLDEDDAHLLLGSVGTPESPIDRSAQVLDAQVVDLEPVDAPRALQAQRPINGPRAIDAPRPVEGPGQIEALRPSRPEGAR